MDAFRIVTEAFRIVMDAGIPPMRRISQFVGPCEDLDLDLLTTIKPGVERTTELLGGATSFAHDLAFSNLLHDRYLVIEKKPAIQSKM